MSTEKTGEITLAIETAVQGGSLSLFQNGREIGNWVGQTKVSKAEEILEQIRILFDKNEIDKNLIKLITVSNGPGSSTGIKIGLSVAKGLCRGLDCRSVSQSILDCLTVKANPRIGGGFLTAVPVGKNLIAWKTFENQLYKNKKNVLQEFEFETFVMELLKRDCPQLVVHQKVYEFLEESNDFPFGKIALNAGENMAAYLNEYQYCLNKVASDNG